MVCCSSLWGIWLRRGGLRRSGELPETYPAIDLRIPIVRRTFEYAALATVINLIIVGTASYRGVQYMDSTSFCGTTCHTVMAPEFTAYQNSPHSHVACVACHIGPGAPWFVRSKLSGLRQVFAVTFHTYSRPIPSPVKYLRPAHETCEQCHWPQRFTGDKFLVNTSHKDDEKNTPQTDVLLLKVGGRTWQGSVGIHGHTWRTAPRSENLASHAIPTTTRRTSRRTEWKDRMLGDHGHDRTYSTLQPIPSFQPSVPSRDETSRSKPPLVSAICQPIQRGRPFQ